MTCVVQEGASIDQRAKVRRQLIWPCGTPRRHSCLGSPLAQDVPWRAVWACVLSLLGACVGTWLLFQKSQTALGPRCSSCAAACLCDALELQVWNVARAGILQNSSQ